MTNRTERVLRQHAWTVGDLIRELSDFDENSPVVFACDYGDHCHTEQALPIEQAEALPAHRFSDTAYSNSGVRISRDDDEDEERPVSEDGEDELLVVVLR